jgi:molybdenum cofactor biosynthesis enzyme MoaA/predicted dehydrogenase
MVRTGQRSVEIHVGGRCSLRCAPCDCRARPSDPQTIERSLKGGGGRALLRGGGDPAALRGVVEQARREGFSEVVVRTNAIAFERAEAAGALREMGVDGVLVPIFAHNPQIHDRITGQPSSLTRALVGMRSLAAAGLSIEIEVPLLPARVQDPKAIVELIHRAVPSLKAVRFFLPTGSIALPLAPPRWGEAGLAAAVARCRELKVTAHLRGQDAIPLCALKDQPELHDAYKFNPRGKRVSVSGCSFPAACHGCVARRQCPGVATSYLEAHGDADIVPYKKRPKEMYAQRNNAARKWTDEQRKAASKATMLVLRPTVNCNQDCTFCSANETTGNVWSDPSEMYRQIARAARRGVDWLSFSGGEPTLSKELPSFIHAAKRCGIKYIEIVTNGVLIDSEKRVNELVNAGLTQAFVSLHAHQESISQMSTQKVGDFPRTVKAVKLLVDRGIGVTLNHVITERNYRYLPKYIEFVHREFGGGTMISFAFVTPQYKVLEDLSQVPRISDVIPFLRRALHRALELGQPFTVGSRQGIPPCFLKEFQGWSDLMKHAHEAKSEDAPQKIRSPKCDECRYTNYCVGLWRPYAERFGMDEIEPVRGTEFADHDVELIRRMLPLGAWSFQRSFDQVPSILRDRAAEAAWPPPPEADPTAVEPERLRLHLPVMQFKRSRPLRVAMFGSGPRARKLAAATARVRGLSIDAVASPHAPDGDLRDFGSCPAYREAADVIQEIRPEAIIIAAATRAHFDLAMLAVENKIPALLEKPLTQTREQADELLRAVQREQVMIMPAHNILFSDGLDRLWDAGPASRVTYSRRCSATSPEAPRMWSKITMYESLYHVIALVVHAAGGGFTRATQAAYRGDTRPERVQLTLASDTAQAEILLDYAVPMDDLSLTLGATDSRPAMTWRRAGRDTVVVTGTREEPVPPTASDLERMLVRFHDAALGEVAPGVTVAEAVEVMSTARVAIEALAQAGAPFDRPQGPKHVASKSLARF